jgi:hypothetical protein
VSEPAWRDAVAEGRLPAPVVLVLGGFITSPPVYRAFARRLLDRGAGDVIVAPVWLPDWLLAARRGLGPIVTRSGRALLAASARSEAVALGAPVLLVGHSAGGVSARLLTSPVPFDGRRLGGAVRIGAVITLGTPHVVSEEHGVGRQAAAAAAFFVNREVPGPAFAPTTGYLAVASRRQVGRRDGTVGELRTWRLYQGLVGDPEAAEIEGDGLVPVRCALLPGAASIVLDDAHHGQWPGRDWYGSDRFLDRWWPAALDAWRAALRARVAAG